MSALNRCPCCGWKTLDANPWAALTLWLARVLAMGLVHASGAA